MEDSETGVEWVVDASGCRPEALRSIETLEGLFERLIEERGLKPLGDTRWHVFPGPGGVTGLLMLTESHLSCHTFPETVSPPSTCSAAGPDRSGPGRNVSSRPWGPGRFVFTGWNGGGGA